MMVSIPSAVTVIQLETAPFRNAADAKDWALSHGIVGKMSNEDTRGKGEVAISITSLEKMLSGSALRKSVTPDIHYASLMRLRDIIRESFVAEIHPDYRKVNGMRSIDNGINAMVEIAVLYGCVAIAGIPYRVKTTLKLHRDPSQPTKAYSYEISNIEVLAGTAGIVIPPNAKTSMDVDILLKFVRRVNGTPYIRDYANGRQEAALCVKRFLSNKVHVVLVSGRSSYSACGAEVFLAPFLKDKQVRGQSDAFNKGFAHANHSFESSAAPSRTLERRTHIQVESQCPSPFESSRCRRQIDSQHTDTGKQSSDNRSGKEYIGIHSLGCAATNQFDKHASSPSGLFD